MQPCEPGNYQRVECVDLYFCDCLLTVYSGCHLVGWIGADIVVVRCLVGTVLLNSSWDAAGDFYDTRSRRFCSDEWSLPV